MDIIFWIALLLLAYAFAGYPCFVWLLAKVFKKIHARQEDYTPSVSLLLSVYNEEAVIEKKIANFLATDYPADKIELIIISDHCEDRTEAIIQELKHPRIRLFIQKEREGKTSALNRAVKNATGDILIFTDANSMFHKDAVQKLVRNFKDPSVGLVSGKSVYLDAANNQKETSGLYPFYECFIKEHESRIGSIVGADGAIYALRRNLYELLNPDQINDFVHTIQVVLQGHRAVYDRLAICYEEIDTRYDAEFNRQTRIMTQAWNIFFSKFGELIRAHKFYYAWELISHKFLRWLTIPLLIALSFSSMLLIGDGNFYQSVFFALLACFFLALAGKRYPNTLLRIPYMFFVLHIAMTLGFYKYLSGSKYRTWQPRSGQ
jgi:cellulose synthase/poly-beta-1,6-N-acetylglucosamine synthase-like glycosyltransferase